MQGQNSVSDGLNAGIKKLKRVLLGSEDIISVIKEDHKPLKELIAIMKDDDKKFSERKNAFQEFAPLLMTHAKAEEKSLYTFMKTNAQLNEQALEGDTEHGIADQLCEEIKRVTGEDEISAKIKVLAELVEHHIEEEENDIFPQVEKQVSEEKLLALTKVYVSIQEQIIADGQDDSPAENTLGKN